MSQPASFYKNKFSGNEKLSGVVSGMGEEATVSAYTFALRGVQKVWVYTVLYFVLS